MNADDLEMARRFAACKGWLWFVGMPAAGVIRVGRFDMLGVHCVTMVDEHGPWTTTGRTASAKGSRTRHARIDDALPDISYPIGRAGLLPVVRRALGMPNLTPIIGADGWYLHGIPDDRPELWWSNGKASELAALLAALEAAP